jgi:hypothetical protein
MQVSVSFLVAFVTTPWRKGQTPKRSDKKHVKLQYWKDHMLIEIKGYPKPVEHQLEKHMEYDGMNKDEVNPNRKHQ